MTGPIKGSTEMLHMRLTVEQRDRAKRCAKYMGFPMTTLAQNALIKELDVIEERMKREGAVRDKKRAPRGMGLEFSEPKPRPATPSAERRAKPQSPDDLERFVLYVAAAETERDARRRVERVLEIVSAGASSDAEVDAIADKLDERVKEMVEERLKDPQFGTVIPGLGDDT